MMLEKKSSFSSKSKVIVFLLQHGEFIQLPSQCLSSTKLNRWSCSHCWPNSSNVLFVMWWSELTNIKPLVQFIIQFRSVRKVNLSVSVYWQRKLIVTALQCFYKELQHSFWLILWHYISNKIIYINMPVPEQWFQQHDCSVISCFVLWVY